MDFLQPETLDEALAMRAERPDAAPITGGTDMMVELNLDKGRPPALLDLGRVEALCAVTRVELRGRPALRIGAGVTWTELIRSHGTDVPGLAIAARTVGSPQIRNRGTLGGNIANASPAGDGLPPLVAADAIVEVASAARGTRLVPAREWIIRPRRSAIEPDELVVAAHVPVIDAARGSEQFAKVGTRNAMVISVCSFAICIDEAERVVGTGIGSAGPTILRALDAEQHLVDTLVERGLWDEPAPLPVDVIERFGELAASAARPIDDVRGTAGYRRHAVGVLARRTLAWAWADRVRHAAGLTTTPGRG